MGAVWYMEVGWSQLDVMRRGVVLGEVVCQVEFSLLPVYSELALFDAVLYPIEPHIHGFGSSDFGASIGKAICGGVIGGNSSWLCLWISYFGEDLPDVHCFLSVVE